MVSVVTLQALYQVTVLLVLNSIFKSVLNLEHDESAHAAKVKNTLIFNGFIFCQVNLPTRMRKFENWKNRKNEIYLDILCWAFLLYCRELFLVI